MSELHAFVKFGIYAVMALSVLAAIGSVTLPNIFHAALGLIVALVGTAGIFIALHADFLAVVQILLYVGAVMTLVIFSIMMTERIADKSIPQKNNLSIPAILSCGTFLFLLIRMLRLTPWNLPAEPLAHVNTYDLGLSLLGTYVFPFEVISVFLIAALIGSIMVAKKPSAPAEKDKSC